MDISQVIQSFRNLSNSNKLTITIGKSISRQCFNISNKIFFDIFKTYLSKNGWFISRQIMNKRFYYKNKYLDTNIQQGTCKVLGLEIPVKQTLALYEKKNEVVKKYRGTYFDIFCQQYNAIELENIDEFSECCSDIYNEVTSEISVFKKSGTNIEVILSVGKEDPAPVFMVQLCLESLEKDDISSIMELVELAMSKYKKTEHTLSSSFTQI